MGLSVHGEVGYNQYKWSKVDESGWRGPVVSGEIGLSGASIGMGYSWKTIYNMFGCIGTTTKLSGLQTFDNPIVGEPDTSYMGIEVTGSCMVFVVKLGTYTNQNSNNLLSLTFGIGI